MNQYEIFQTVFYGNASDVSPNFIMQQDHNFEILLFCINERTKEELIEKNIQNKTIQLLIKYRLLKCENGLYKTNIPILKENETKRLRTYTEKLSRHVYKNILNDVKELLSQLKQQGYEKQAYSLLFSFILDYLAWQYITLADVSMGESDEFWNGVVYSVYPKRHNRSGTNTIDSDDLTLFINWNEGSIPIIFESVGWMSGYQALFDEVKEYNNVKHLDLINKFKTYGICNEDGLLTIPSIKKGDAIYNGCKKIAMNLARNINQIELNELLEWFKIDNKKEAVIILYHEVIWDIMHLLETKSDVMKPSLFKDKNELKYVSELMFFIKG